MRGVWLVGVSLFLGSVAWGADPPTRREGTLKVGDSAPVFTVKDVEGKETTKLADLKGKPVVLIFGSCT